ncbi:MAG: Rpn family recombination-promoting nuclease/putative transposase [Eubacterium sp.]
MYFDKEHFASLRFTDDYVFCTVLSENKELCRELVERILGRKIERIVYLNDQQSIRVTPDSKGVRFDVYFEDDQNTVYDIEMQNDNQGNLLRRSRYYQSVIDTEQIKAGEPYEKLKSSYVIFISTFDPLKCGYSLYEIVPMCRNHQKVEFDDGTRRIFLNSCGTKDEELSDELKAFLNYLSNHIPTDDFTRNLEAQVQKTTGNEDWRRQYMTLEEKIELGRREGLEIGIEKGRSEGLKEGRDENRCEMIRNMVKNGLSVEMIASIAGLTAEELCSFCDKYGIDLGE